MTANEFVKTFLPHAKLTESKTGISALVILAQGALESGWGKYAPSNMFFGIKDTDGINGNEQLITTTEYSKRADLKFPKILKVEPTARNGQKYFKYTVQDYFRKYTTPEECFTDHATFFLTNPRYAKALLVKSDPYKFAEEIAKAGYATDPNYASVLKSMIDSVKKRIV